MVKQEVMSRNDGILYKYTELPADSTIYIWHPYGSDNRNLYKITMEGNQFPDLELVDAPDGKQLQVSGDFEFLVAEIAECGADRPYLESDLARYILDGAHTRTEKKATKTIEGTDCLDGSYITVYLIPCFSIREGSICRGCEGLI